MAFFAKNTSRHIIQTKLVVLHSSFQSNSISCVFYNLAEMSIESDPPKNLITDVPFETCEAQSCWRKQAGAKTSCLIEWNELHCLSPRTTA